MVFGYRKAAAAGVLLLSASGIAIAPGGAHEAPEDEGRICNPVQDSTKSPVVSATGRYVKHAGTYECPPKPVVEAPKEERVVLASVSSDVLFDFDKYNLKPEARSELDRIVKMLSDSPETKFEVVGHADHTGPVDYNQGLSERRARSVANYLIDHGIDPERFTVAGRGETQPVASNETREGRAKNRRVELESR